MIDFLEIRAADLKVIGILDTAQSVIWHSVYFGVGDFEIYTPATPEMVNLLTTGNYVTRTDNAEVGVIEKLAIINDIESGRMITASGRFAKSVLDRRLIYNLNGNSNKATILRGNLETAIREVVQDNAISCAFDPRRNIDVLILGDVAGIPTNITDANGKATKKQVSYKNLLEYTDGALAEYGIAARCVLENNKLQYTIYSGADRSTGNSSGNVPVVFSQAFDNLVNSDYMHDTAEEKNAALIGGEGEGLARFYSFITDGKTGLQRREIFIDAASIARGYTDENEVEQTYTDEEYKELLDAQGVQDLAPLVEVETFSGTVDITNGNYVYGRDFWLGVIVTVQDNELRKYINVRITEATEVQDVNGYTVDVKYE